jgi:hypothetical protein
MVFAVFATAAAPKLHAASFDEAAERYRGFMIADMDRALVGAQTLRDRIKANDIPAPRKPGSMPGSAGSAPRSSPADSFPSLTTPSMPGKVSRRAHAVRDPTAKRTMMLLRSCFGISKTFCAQDVHAHPIRAQEIRSQEMTFTIPTALAGRVESSLIATLRTAG